MRSFLFWTLDFLKGSKFKFHLEEIKNLQVNYEANVSRRKELLTGVLDFSIENTDFYKDYKATTSIENFPVVNKHIIKSQFSKFQSNKFSNKKLFKVATSGSTGTPFITYLNESKKLRNSADTLFFSEKAGFRLGDKLFYIRLWDKQHNKGKFGYWIKNIVSHDISNLTDNDIKELLQKISTSKQHIGLLGYSSAFDSICKYLDKTNSKRLNTNIRSAIGISESLSAYAKKKMQYYFNCPIVSRYSASETGIIAQQMINKSYFEVNWASYFVEILDLESDTAVPHGTIGRIVITDLFNYAIPLIRYDTGDLGVLDKVDNLEAPVLTRVEGRKMDMLYTTSGEFITSHIVHQICLFEGINQYQLIQNSVNEYTFKINASNFTKEEELIELYKNYLGEDALIDVVYVNDIPLLSSGKRKKVVNNYYG